MAVFHLRAGRLVIVVKSVGVIQCLLASGKSLTWDARDHVLLKHGPLGEVSHR